MASLSSRRSLTYKNSEPGSLFLIAALILTALLTSCNPNSDQRQLVSFHGPIMGTDYRVTVLVPSETNLEQLEASIVSAMQAVNQSMSTYLADSELSQLNRLPAHVEFIMSTDLAAVLNEAQRISILSDGAFDVTLGQAIDLWGFGPDGIISKRPNDDLLQALRGSVGYNLLTVKGRSVRKQVDGLSISLSAIAKGFAVDQVANRLHAQDLANFLVNIGGELKASGRKDDGSKWKIGIEKPHLLGGVQQVIALNNEAIATSGDYRNYHVIDGQQFSHTIDPITLTPVYHNLALVSVLSDSAMTADALATAMMAMGDAAAFKFAQQHNLSAYLIIREPQKGQYRIEMTDSFRGYLQ